MQKVDESFRILRVALEVRYAEPAVFAVTSAHEKDGAGYVAVGLARAFGAVGAQTLLISSTAQQGDMPPYFGNTGRFGNPARVVGEQNLDLLVLPLPDGDGDGGATATELRSKMSGFRSRYRAIVLDTAPMPVNALACELVREADAVLLAFRMGRTAIDADRELMRLLGALERDVVGVVPTRGIKEAPVLSTVARERAEIVEAEPIPRIALRQVEIIH